jgi:hypothetical protein
LDCCVVLSDEKRVIKIAKDNDQEAYFRFRDGKEVVTPKKTTSTVDEIMQKALYGAAKHHAEVTSIVKIDDILAFTEKQFGKPTLREVEQLERTMGQKASDKWKR